MQVLKASRVISFSDELAAANVAAAVPEPTACLPGDQVGEFTCVCKVNSLQHPPFRPSSPTHTARTQGLCVSSCTHA
jgi:hypothetical protein